MPSPRPELRKRRYQTRSRSGCITCKAKHIRCDEKKPLCIHRVLSNPAFLHFVLLLSSIRWTWDTGSMQRIRRSYLHHKLEAIKFVNEQLEDPKTALADSTVATIVGLALAESALGNRDTATAHMNGLAKIAQMREGDAVSSGSTFPGLMILTSMGASETSIHELLNVLEGIEDRKPPTLCRHHAAGDRLNGDTKTCAMSAAHVVLENSARRGAAAELGSRVPSTVSESRSRLMSCYLMMFVILGTDSIDPFIVNWLVEWMLSNLCYEEEVVRRGEFPRQLWFWGAMKSMCVVTAAARAISDLEARQIDRWRALCREKIRLVSRTLSLKNWEHVKEMFAGLVWRDGLAEEHQIREMWEEAVSGECVVMMPVATPSYVDRYDFMSAEERERSISMVQ
ncbi:hypothetical protein F4775DRAFT_589304 [Biscogniauxia sp. FL1348]|nr:hypothetical protein F4775DRAFT_589304 [Biscogniauxia sp. FL1348]